MSKHFTKEEIVTILADKKFYGAYDIRRELVIVNLYLTYKFIYGIGKDPKNYELHTWYSGNSTQKTFVFTPIDGGDCLVFFNGKFAYSAPATEKFMEDVVDHCVAGVRGASKYRGGV